MNKFETQQYLMKLYRECLEECDNLDIPYSKNITEVTVNTRAKARWGQCHREYNEWDYEYYFTININVDILNPQVVPSDRAKNTIMHEILHTIDDCFDHGKEWQYWADLVNDCYGFYHISRCSSASDFSSELEKQYREQKQAKRAKSLENWQFTCLECKHVYKHQRKPQWLSYWGWDDNLIVKGAHCRCGGKLKMTKYKDLNVKYVASSAY